jgi:hypothetical protein
MDDRLASSVLLKFETNDVAWLAAGRAMHTVIAGLWGRRVSCGVYPAKSVLLTPQQRHLVGLQDLVLSSSPAIRLSYSAR